MMDEIEMLFSKATDPATLRPDPNDARYSVPHTWGVYEVGGARTGPAGKPFRKGNHPIREKELQRKFREVTRVALFTEEQLAIRLMDQLNVRSSR